MWQVDGFPPKEVVKTVFVEHDIQGDLGELNLVDYVQVSLSRRCLALASSLSFIPSCIHVLVFAAYLCFV